MNKISIFVAALALLGSHGANAQDGTVRDRIHLGAGVGVNDLDPFDNAIGFQFFGGYDFNYKLADEFDTAVEVGYMNTGDFAAIGFNYGSIEGPWVTGLASYPINQELDLLGRLGLDLGDDDGLIFGFGVGFALKQNMELRGEYVIRDNVNSLQANFVYHL